MSSLAESLGRKIKAMRRSFLSAATAAAIFCALSVPVTAHHSFASFDMQRSITIKGEIVVFKWTNPHSWIEINVPTRAGPERWSIEMNSPNNLAREGWKRTTLKAGDAVILVIHPLRDGGKGGSYVGVRLPDGSTLGEIK
jgi:hypothetical protein